MSRWQRIPAAIVDAALAAAMAVVVVLMIALGGEPGAQEPDALAYGLGLTIAALVLGRRRWPLGVLVASYAALTLYHVLNYPATVLALPLSVALYTAAAAGHLGWALAAVATQLAVAAWYRLLVEGEPLRAVIVNGAVLDAALLIALVLFGEAVRSRRAWQAEVAERLRRADADREREAERRVGLERLRIARELHDVLAHTVAVITVQAGVAADVLDGRPDQARAALRTIRAASREAMTELKATVGVLRDGTTAVEVPLAPTPGVGLLAGLLAETRSAGLHAILAVDGDARPLPGAVDLTAYRIVQESLTNVLRHGGATAVAVSIGYEPDAVVLSVADDGAGSGPEAPGYGLIGMQERVAALGGDLNAGPGPDGGFRVCARLPTALART